MEGLEALSLGAINDHGTTVIGHGQHLEVLNMHSREFPKVAKMHIIHHMGQAG